jgi:glycosyltransferase involved in cell wall biosynthesis
MAISVVIITKDRPLQVKRLLNSVFGLKIRGLSVVVVDDSADENFRTTEAFILRFKDICEHKSSSQLRRDVCGLLKESKISAETRPLIETCIGVRSPFADFTESVSKVTLFRKSFGTLVSQSFAPYSTARNLGIFHACRVFRPEKIVFSDDDCFVTGPERLKGALQLVGERISGKEIIAVSGLYEDLSLLHVKVGHPNERHRSASVLSGMSSFLKRSFLTEQQQRLTFMPHHMLGGTLILSKKVFVSLPFDPFIPRGEDHAYCVDLKVRCGKNFLIVRDNEFVVQHSSNLKNSEDVQNKNAMRDIFRFVYLRFKTGKNFIPLFNVRWASDILLHAFLRPSDARQRLLELWSLLVLARIYGRKNARKYNQLVKAWNHFLGSMVLWTFRKSKRAL